MTVSGEVYRLPRHPAFAVSPALDIQKIITQILTHPWILGVFFVVTLLVNLLALRRIRKEEPHKYQKPGQQ
ncbi:MAG: hypothetical protein HY847_14100 [Betaproteobacteria bacterium]|nr:hypothetical protein [Betaproteobacteria bacterium]